MELKAANAGNYRQTWHAATAKEKRKYINGQKATLIKERSCSFLAMGYSHDHEGSHPL